MKYILKFERYFPQAENTPEETSNMNQFNLDENHIKEFLQKKLKLQDIYNTYTDEKDLINKLKAQKFISGASVKKNIKYNNPLLGLWANSCEKRREIKDINDDIQKWEKDMGEENAKIPNNPSIKDTISDQVKLIQDRIKLKKEELNKKSQEVADLEKMTRDKLNLMKKQQNNSKLRIDSDQNDKNIK